MGLGPGRTCWVAISATVASLACKPHRLNPVGSVQLATQRTGGWPMISVSTSTSSQWSPKSVHLDSSISAVSWVGGRAFGCWLRWYDIATVTKAAEGGGLGHGAGGQPELLLGREPCSPLDVPPPPTSHKVASYHQCPEQGPLRPICARGLLVALKLDFHFELQLLSSFLDRGFW